MLGLKVKLMTNTNSGFKKENELL